MTKPATHTLGGVPFPTATELRKKSKMLRDVWASIRQNDDEERACPRFAEHTDRALGMPDGYFAREAWWRKMKKTHTQRKCRGCHRYAVWTTKRRKS